MASETDVAAVPKRPAVNDERDVRLSMEDRDQKTESPLAVVDHALEHCQLALDRTGRNGFAVLQPVLQTPVAVILKMLRLEIDGRVGAQRPLLTLEAPQPGRLCHLRTRARAMGSHAGQIEFDRRAWFPSLPIGCFLKKQRIANSAATPAHPVAIMSNTNSGTVDMAGRSPMRYTLV